MRKNAFLDIKSEFYSYIISVNPKSWVTFFSIMIGWDIYA